MSQATSTRISLLSEEERRAATEDIISYFLDIRDEEIGIIAAEDILDMFLDKLGNKIYNKAIDDSSRFIWVWGHYRGEGRRGRSAHSGHDYL